MASVTSKQGGERYTLDHNTATFIGGGSFGDVKIGRTDDGQEVAVKISSTPQSIKCARREIELLLGFIGEPNIVQLKGFHHLIDPTGKSPPTLTFAMELAECSLDKLMRNGPNIRGLPQDVLIDFVADCCSAMKSLRAKKIAHRDIKHMNVLVFRCKAKTRKSTYLFKFCDLGAANIMSDTTGMNSLVGTPNVLHPRIAGELARGRSSASRVAEGYSGDECDFWSLACTLHFAACGHYPFPHSSVNNYQLYFQCVDNLPKDCIAASYIEGSVPFRFNYRKEIENARYPQWFRHVFSSLLRNLFHKPSLESYERMANALISCKEYTFLSVAQLDVVKYADLSSEDLFSEGYPSVKDCLGVKNIDCRLIGEDEDVQMLTNNLSRLSTKTAYVVCPLAREIVAAPKTWETVAKSENLLNRDQPWEAFEVRAAYLGKGFVALHDADKMCTLFEDTKDTITQQMKTLRMRVVAEKDSAALPHRFATYAGCKYQSWLVHDPKEKALIMQGIESAQSATSNLTRVVSQLDSMVKQLDEMLGQVERLQLDEHELPGIEAELMRYTYCDRYSQQIYVDDVRKSTRYAQKLVQKCFERRTAVATELCGKMGEAKQPLRDTLLQTASRLLHFSNELFQLKGHIEECTMTIERPFQEMKTRVESMKNDMNISDKDLRKSVAYHNRPAKIDSSSAEINKLAKQLNELIGTLQKQRQ